MNYKNMDMVATEAWHYYSLGRFRQVIEIINDGLSLNPQEAGLYYIKANCCYQLEQYEEAQDCCEQALRLKHSPCDCYFLMGKIALETGKHVISEELLLKALELEPNRADVISVYGILMLKTGHDKRALLLIEEALKIDPDNATANQVKFMYYLIKNKKEPLTASLRKCLQVGVNEKSKLYQIGVMELNKKKYKAARESFRQAFLLDPMDEELLDILHNLDRETSLLFLPQRIIQKLGGPIVIWIAAIASIYILRGLHFYTAMIAFSLFYAILCIYTWISPLIYKVISKYK